jgi:hypothetical protein
MTFDDPETKGALASLHASLCQGSLLFINQAANLLKIILALVRAKERRLNRPGHSKYTGEDT